MTRSGGGQSTTSTATSNLPSLLRNLTTSTSKSVASIDSSTVNPSISTSTSSNDDTHSITSSTRRQKRQTIRSRKPSQLSIQRQDSPTTTLNLPRDSRPEISHTDTTQSTVTDDGITTDETRSRASSDASSLQGLTARLQGARRGKNPKGSDESDDGDQTSRTVSLRQAEDKEVESQEVPKVVVSTAEAIDSLPETKVLDTTASLPLKEEPSAPDSPNLVHTRQHSTSSSQFRITRDDSDTERLSIRTSSSISSDDDRSSDRSDEESQEEEEEEDEQVDLVTRSESHPDPRDMLRAQLTKTQPQSSIQSKEDDYAGLGEGGGGSRMKIDRSFSGISARSNRSSRMTEDVKGKAKEGMRKFEPRRYFILSTAGKLVYTSERNEEMATGLVGAMQAIVSIFADEGDKIRSVEVGDSRITFLLKSPLYLVVSSSWGEPESVSRTHLDYLYLQVLSVVTLTQLQNIFSRRSNFDLRAMMQGTEPFFHSLVSSLQTSIPIVTSSIEVYRIDPNVRTEIAKALDPGREVTKKLDLLYVLLLAHGRLVTLLRPKKHSIHPTDLHLLLSTIYSTSNSSRPSDARGSHDQENRIGGDHEVEEGTTRSTRSSPLTEPGLESWLPICLPRFNPKGFLHAYVSFLSPSTPSLTHSTTKTIDRSDDGGIGLVLLSTDRDAFLGVKDAAEEIKDNLMGSSGNHGGGGGGGSKGGKAGGGLIHEIEKCRSVQEYSLGELAIPGLRHFVYKSKSYVQSTRPAWEGDYVPLQARYRLITLYQQLSDTLHPRPAQSGMQAKKPAQVQYLRTEHEAVLGWSTPQFELYLTTSPVLPHSAVVSAAKQVSRWVEKHEQGLFLTSSPSF